jgi:hypothetical protein
MPQATHAAVKRDSSTNEGHDSGSRPAGGQGGSGFHARFKGASLADLVQMACLSGTKAVVRVTCGSKVGHLFFRGGALVHASTPSLTGEPAAMEMLSWNWGTFEPAELEWTRDTISASWQGLLMRAAQIMDEGGETGEGSVVALHTEVYERRMQSRPDEVEAEPDFEECIEFDETPLDLGHQALRAEDFDLYVRMNPDGKVLTSHGSTQAFAGVIAFAARLAQLAGDQLGLEGFRAMECTLEETQYFVVLEAGGGIVVLQPRTRVDADSVRETLGL